MDLTSSSQEELDISEERKNLKKVEAALFISARYLSIQELVELTDINPLLLKELLEKLRDYYQKMDSSIEILNKDDFWKMDIRQEYFKMINKLATGKAELSKAEQETLAIIAYKQPVKQSVIIKIRGNKAYDHVKHFTDIGLVKSRKAGHTNELSLSESFYDYFHLEKKKNSANRDRDEALEIPENENSN
jgi:segregation and condensation protein B